MALIEISYRNDPLGVIICRKINGLDIGQYAEIQYIEVEKQANIHVKYSEKLFLFKEINKQQIPGLIERSQLHKRRRKLFFFLEEVRPRLASPFLEFEDFDRKQCCLISDTAYPCPYPTQYFSERKLFLKTPDDMFQLQA